MSQPPIFVSYRRDSDVLRATLVRSVIEGAFNRGIDGPKVAVFQDIRQRPGVDWPIEIRARLHEARVVVAVIGPQWLTTQDSGRRRIDQDDDWVRQELQVALSSDKTVIPVLFETAMPEPEALPESIRDLANKLVVRVSDERVEDELQPLLSELEEHLVTTSSRRRVASADSRELSYPDPPLPVKPAPMSDTDIAAALTDMIPGWTVEASPLPEDRSVTRHELHREYRFASFGDALRLMVECGEFIEKVNHHPRWENVYRTLRVNISTWDIGHKVSYSDVSLAKVLDDVYQRYNEGATA